MNRFITLSLLCGAMALYAPLASAKEHQLTSTITWELTPDSVLRITGTGKMPNFDPNFTGHWCNKETAGKVRRIVVSEGITQVGDYNFYSPRIDSSYNRRQQGDYNTLYDSDRIGYYTNIESISLPSTLTRIGSHAFELMMVTHLPIPSGVTEIGNSAFTCSDLRYVKLPAGLQKLGRNAFEGCINLHAADVNGAAIDINEGVFFMCERMITLRNIYNVNELHHTALDCTPMARISDPKGAFMDDCLRGFLAENVIPWDEFAANNKLPRPKLTDGAQDRIKQDIKQWKKARKDETDGQWRLRVSPYTTAERIDSLTYADALQYPQENEAYLTRHEQLRKQYEQNRKLIVQTYFDQQTKHQTAMFHLDRFDLSPYNSDNGNYVISTAYHGSIIVPIAEDDAKAFEAAWPEIINNAALSYVPQGEDVKLRNVTFTLGDKTIIAAVLAN